MAAHPFSCPPFLALFQKRIDGDDALLELARLRFEQAGLGPEFYAETPEELEWLLQFRPAGPAPAVVHLARWIDILNPGHCRLIREFGTRFSGRIFGMVVHDQPEAVTMRQDYLFALAALGTDLKSAGAPLLFIEYAAGLAPEDFISLCRQMKDRGSIGPCIDTGHLSIRRVRDLFGAVHPGSDVCALRPDDPELPGLIVHVQRAAAGAREQVIKDIWEICRIGRPVHFHLHDGHPLSHTSPFGVSDHLSFLAEIPLPFEWEGKRSLPGILGPGGLKQVIEAAGGIVGGHGCSMSLEIHPSDGRLPLGDAEGLFGNWRDKGNAERMNHWLNLLADNHRLLLKTCS